MIFKNRMLLLYLISCLAVPVAADQTVFNTIAKGNTLELQQWLQQPASNLELTDGSGNTLLLQAAKKNHMAVVELLLKSGANVNALNDQKRDVLNTAVSNKNVAMAKLALQYGADPTLVTSIYQGSALIYATHQGQVEIVELLIAAGAPLNRVNNLGWTTLLEATILGDGGVAHQRIVDALITAGADATIRDREGRSPLDHAIARGHTVLVKRLQN